MQSFDEIYVIDLHGSTTKKEKCPDGSKDENVFDIQQGVAISIFVKNGIKNESCDVYYSEFWGLRDDKYDWLVENNINSIEWTKLHPTSPYYFFINRDDKDRDIYESFLKITDAFPVKVTGIITARDKFAIGFDNDEILNRLEIFKNPSFTDDFVREMFKLKDTRGWALTEARKKIAKVEDTNFNFNRILYRPFDIRSIYYSSDIIDWPRSEVMTNMLKENVGFVFHKREELNIPYSHFFVTNTIVEHCAVSIKTICYMAPLYIYPDTEAPFIKGLSNDANAMRPNLNMKIISSLSSIYKKEKIEPEELFYYIYGVVYSKIYQEKYLEFLKMDYPRIPFTTDYNLFIELGKLGRKLAEIHLLNSPEVNETSSRFEIDGDNQVKKVRYSSTEKRIYINKTQYFSNIDQDIWNYHIGGYQVLDKWLKDRNKRALGYNEILHYIKVVRALQLTIHYQKQIDALYPRVEENLIKFK